MRHTHTYTELEVSPETIRDIHKRLEQAGVEMRAYVGIEDGRETILLPGIQLIEELVPRADKPRVPFGRLLEEIADESGTE